MTEQQRLAFEAAAILRAHTNLFAALIENGNVDHMQEQMQNLQAALSALVALSEKQKQAA